MNVGVMQCVGNGGSQFRRISEGRLSLSHPDRQIVPFDELRHGETQAVFRATHIKDWDDVAMVKSGEDLGFSEKRFQIIGVGEPLPALAP